MKKVGIVFLVTIISCSLASGVQRAQPKKNHLKVRSAWAETAETNDLVRLLVDAGNAFRGFDRGGERLDQMQRAGKLQEYLSLLNNFADAKLNESQARRELSQQSIRDTIVGLIRSIKGDASLAVLASSPQIEQLANKVKFRGK